MESNNRPNEFVKPMTNTEDKPMGEYFYAPNHQPQQKALDKKLNSEEQRRAERAEKKYYTAFRLIVGCLLMLGLIYLLDAIVATAFNQNLEHTNSVMEIIKTMLFTLSGYLFGKKESGD